MGINSSLRADWATVLQSSEGIDVRQIVKDNSEIFIFPFDVHTGIINVTNNGPKPTNAIPTDYVDFNKVFTGQAGTIAQWRNAQSIKTQVDPNPPHPVLNLSSRTFKKGDFIKGFYNVSDQGAQFSTYENGNLGNFVVQQAVRNWVLKSTYQFTENDLFSFYIIPSFVQADPTGLNQEVQWLYISSISHYRNPRGEFVYDEVTFTSVNDKLANTGQQINGYIQMGALGEGVAFPQMEYDNAGKETGFHLNPNLMKDYGVHSLQIEIEGNAGIGSVFAIGRPIDAIGAINLNIYPPRLLFAQNWQLGIPDPLTRKADITNIYYLTNGTPEIESYFNSWKEQMQSSFMDTVKKQYDGFLETMSTETQATNPDKKIVNDSTWQISSFPKSSIGGVQENAIYDVRSNQYFNVTVPDGTRTYGYGGTIDMAGSAGGGNPFIMQAWDVLNLTGLMFNHMITLPMVSAQAVSWSLRSIPIFGALAWSLSFGMWNVGWRDTTITSDFPKFLGAPMFVNSTVYDLYINSLWTAKPDSALDDILVDLNPFSSANTGRVFLDAFKGGEDQVGGLLGINAVSHAVTFQLTDKCLLEEWDDATAHSDTEPSGVFTKCSTLYLGQLSDEGKGTTKYLWNPWKSRQLSSYDRGPFITDTNGCGNYIIDAIGVFALGSAPIRIMALSSDPSQTVPYNNIIWNTTLQSQGMFSGNVRDWLTIYKTSYLDDYLDDNIKYLFPQALNPPRPGQVSKNPINIPNTDYQWNIVSDMITDLNLGPGTTDNSFQDAPNQKVLYDFSAQGYTDWNQVVQDYSTLTFNWSAQFLRGFAQLEGEHGPIITDESYNISTQVNNQQFSISLTAISSAPSRGPNGIMSITGFINGIPASAYFQNTSYPVPPKQTNHEIGVNSRGLINNTAFSSAFTNDGVKLIWNREVNCVSLKGNQNGRSIWQASSTQSVFTINGDITITATGN